MHLHRHLRQRTDLIRIFFRQGRFGMEQMKRDIENEVPPWEPGYFDPDYDSPEPAFLNEWLQAESTRDLVGMLAVSLLSDTLKVYFAELGAEMGIRFKDDDERKTYFRKGFVEPYRKILKHVFGYRFEECPARFDLIEQVVLARNDFAHNEDLVSFETRHGTTTIKKHQNPFFIDEKRRSGIDESLPWHFENIGVTEAKLMEAVDEVEKLADWVTENYDAIIAWRHQNSGVPLHLPLPN